VCDYHDRKYPGELGVTAPKGRADGLRDSFWCMKREMMYSINLSDRVEHGLRDVYNWYTLQKKGLDDDTFGAGILSDIWMDYVILSRKRCASKALK
jgi:hypothetical protein